MKEDFISFMSSVLEQTCNKHGCSDPVIPRGKYCETHRTRKKICVEPGCNNGSRVQSDRCKAHGGGKRCIEPGCKNSSVDKTNKCMSHGGGKRCVEPLCTKTAKGSTTKCIEHGGGRRCIQPNCTKGAIGKTDLCKKHGGGLRCVEPQCTKSAKGASQRCIAHGGGKRCTHPQCNKAAIGHTNMCTEHGGGNRCIELNCNRRVDTKNGRCTSHGGGKRCIESGCTKLSAFKSDRCKKHGGGERCIELGCNKGAQGNTNKCGAHGGGRRCPNCINWIDSRCGSVRNDWYCATCFKRLFPDDPRSKVIHEHTKEIRVRNAISERFTGFIHDQPLYTGGCDCTHRRRIDHRKLIGNTILAIETDEFAHQGYDRNDEVIRYDDLYMIHSGKWVYIRFNPDHTKNNKTDLEDRIVILMNEIEKQIYRIETENNTELVEIVKLFY